MIKLAVIKDEKISKGTYIAAVPGSTHLDVKVSTMIKKHLVIITVKTSKERMDELLHEYDMDRESEIQVPEYYDMSSLKYSVKNGILKITLNADDEQIVTFSAS